MSIPLSETAEAMMLQRVLDKLDVLVKELGEVRTSLARMEGSNTELGRRVSALDAHFETLLPLATQVRQLEERVTGLAVKVRAIEDALGARNETAAEERGRSGAWFAVLGAVGVIVLGIAVKVLLGQ